MTSHENGLTNDALPQIGQAAGIRNKDGPTKG